MNCNGDNNDAAIYWGEPLPLDSGQVYAVLGDRPQDCTEVTEQMVPRGTDTSAVGHPALKGMFMVALRNYVVPGTARGADPSKLLPPRNLTFTKP